MAIEALIAAVPPPEDPAGTFLGPWEPVEAEIGLPLPEDYKAFCRVYGLGYFMEFLCVEIPRIKNLNACLEYQIPRICDSFTDRDELPYPLWPKAGGLVPFGGTDNGDYLFWRPRGQPADWGIVVRDRAYGEFSAFDCDLTDFLAGLATGEIEPEQFPQLLMCERLFEPATPGQLMWPPVRTTP